MQGVRVDLSHPDKETETKWAGEWKQQAEVQRVIWGMLRQVCAGTTAVPWGIRHLHSGPPPPAASLPFRWQIPITPWPEGLVFQEKPEIWAGGG